jgi:hypothetical protein
MSRALSFVAGEFTLGFTTRYSRPPRLSGHLTQCLGHRHVAQHSFSLGPSPCSAASSARPGYYGFCCLLAPAQHRRPFRHKARSPQVRVALLHRTTAAFTPPCLDHESFVVSCPLALLGSAFYAVLVHRLAIYAPRFLPTLGRPRAVALHFVRRDQLTTGLAPAGVRPCWAHMKKAPIAAAIGAFCRRRPLSAMQRPRGPEPLERSGAIAGRAPTHGPATTARWGR